ncbi:hypothetical protein KKC32_00030 [Patescibacteria group bacterium]|nr:hypothetical protein [Patescibacteria group bacterium]
MTTVKNKDEDKVIDLEKERMRRRTEIQGAESNISGEKEAEATVIDFNEAAERLELKDLLAKMKKQVAELNRYADIELPENLK